jgi:hypothetical protein
VATYELGAEPEDLTVRLYRGAGFDASMVFEVDGRVADWPDGASVRLIFSPARTDPAPVTWPALVEGSVAAWDVAPVDAAERPNGEPVELWVDDQPWARGRVSRRGD